MSKDTTIAAFRFGYGLPLPKDAPKHPGAMLSALDRDDTARSDYPGASFEAMQPLMQLADDTLKTARRGAPAEAELGRTAFREAVSQIEAMALSTARAQFARALDGRNELRERLVWFWADHFTTTARARRDAALPAALVDEAIRPHVNSRFADMLKAVMQHPAMLIYLDQSVSIGPNSRVGQRRDKGLNENLAREMLELHTLGSGYSQDDVTQMAKLLTGLTIDKTGVTFDPRRHEPGPETIQGLVYEGDDLAAIHAALEDLAISPLTAHHLANKLAVHFVSNTPDPELVAEIEMAWRNSGGDLVAVTGALVSHPAAWGINQPKARQPFEFMIAALRALGLGPQDVLQMDDKTFKAQLMTPLTAMGQPWQSPPGPDGWPEAPTAWITPQAMAARITWAMEMPQKLVKSLPEPVEFANRVLGVHVSAPLLQAISRAETLREAVGFVLASPAFNRR